MMMDWVDEDCEPLKKWLAKVFTLPVYCQIIASVTPEMVEEYRRYRDEYVQNNLDNMGSGGCHNRDDSPI